MSEFYTRTGDDGTSGLLGDSRVPKHHPQLEAVGAVDEANAALGVVRSLVDSPIIKEIIITIQRDLYHIMAEVSASPENAARFRKIDHARVKWLEEQIEIIGNQVQLPRGFIVPGDTREGALLDLTRTIIRRAERRTSFLFLNSALENNQILPYLNRLSTLCFLLELWETGDKDSPITLTKQIET